MHILVERDIISALDFMLRNKLQGYYPDYETQNTQTTELYMKLSQIAQAQGVTLYESLEAKQLIKDILESLKTKAAETFGSDHVFNDADLMRVVGGYKVVIDIAKDLTNITN